MAPPAVSSASDRPDGQSLVTVWLEMTLVSISAAFHLGNFFLVCRPHPTVDGATQGSHAQLRRWSPRVALDRHVPGDGLRGLSGLAEHAAHEGPQLECCAPLPPTATTWAAPRARYAPRRVQPSTARVRPRTVLRLGASREQSCVLARACSRVLCRRVLQGCWGGGGGCGNGRGGDLLLFCVTGNQSELCCTSVEIQSFCSRQQIYYCRPCEQIETLQAIGL